MFKCDELIYIQLQKTGCTHIALLLSKLFNGEVIGKHNAVNPEQYKSTKYFISSIRNPWDWYLSLWTFGVQGNGSLMHRLTKKNVNRPLNFMLKHPIKYYRRFLNRSIKNIEIWRGVYDKSDNVESFREWLRLIHNSKNSNYLGEGYGKTAITDFCGFMTYRYLFLCCRNLKILKNPREISNLDDLSRFDLENCYIDYFIRQEKLEDSFCEAIELIRPITQNEKRLIYGLKKTNTSKRTFSISDYYDQKSIELIQIRDKLLIDKFNYLPPKLNN